MSTEGTGAGDVARILIGAVVVGAIAAAIVAGPLTKKTVSPRGSAPSPGFVTLATEKGLDISGGTPSVKRDRLVAAFDAGEMTAWNELTHNAGVISDAEGTLFTGYLAATHEDGTPSILACAINGRLEGPCIRLHQNGTLQSSWGYSGGELAGQMIEYYPNGSLKLRCVAGPRAQSGGTEIAEITLARPTATGSESTSLGSGRLQFLDANGTTASTNEARDPAGIDGFMLFTYGWYGRESLAVNDSRLLVLPSGG